ncbi:unnamed protein product [Rodentolepis nana]|uniref:Uncharacterized protein n=1 Tax=Rodentolepis nana TaxID=102285 RepID=A0A3P7SDG8_RODNA|nr:unnamed protein product [Rodentolepis nana]
MQKLSDHYTPPGQYLQDPQHRTKPRQPLQTTIPNDRLSPLSGTTSVRNNDYATTFLSAISKL